MPFTIPPVIIDTDADKINVYEIDDLDGVSIPSVANYIVEIPEVFHHSGRFIYRSWMEDERVNENVVESVIEAMSRVSMTTGQRKENLKYQNLPRKIELSWTRPSMIGEYSNVSGPRKTGAKRYIEESEASGKISISDNLDKIVNEESFSNTSMTGITIVDNESFSKAYSVARTAVSLLSEPMPSSAAKDEYFASSESDSTEVDIGSIRRANILKQKADLASSVSGKQDIVAKLMGNIQSEGFSYSAGESTEKSIQRSLDPTKSSSLNMSLNSAIAYDVILAAAADKTRIYSDEFQSMLSDLNSLKKQKIENFQSGVIRESEYDFSIPSVDLEARRYTQYTNPSAVPNRYRKIAYVAGFIIEKQEVTKRGFRRNHDPIIVEDGFQTTVIDTNVRYGSTYIYNIKTVVMVKFEGVLDHADGTSQNAISTSLIASRGPDEIVVTCREDKPPDPPTDLTFDFFPHDDVLSIIWEFPINKQKDIKRFHVFRRSSVYDPFSLIAEYDFDTTQDPVFLKEKIPSKLTKKTKYPICIHDDFDFDYDKKEIYAICSVDAHGNVSNYSAQFEVSVDPVTRKAYKKMISRSGAPRTYPNIYLEYDSFVDTIKTSMFKDLRIYFDPEYLEVFDKNDADLKLITTSKWWKKLPDYRINFINLDLQSSELFDIKISDKRDEEAKATLESRMYIQNQKT
jgi:hypothetical protein